MKQTNNLTSIFQLKLATLFTQSQAPKQLTSSMLRDFRQRFDIILVPSSDCFNPVPAAACTSLYLYEGQACTSVHAARMLDPSLCQIMLAVELAPLPHAAKAFVVSLGSPGEVSVAERSNTTAPPALKKFKFLAERFRQNELPTPTAVGQESVVGQLTRYLSDINSANSICGEDGLVFWAARKSIYGLLVPIAEDLITAPASQAYVERIFSLCGILSSGRRNRMTRSLETRVFLRLNQKII